jgi:hypothetical protein
MYWKNIAHLIQTETVQNAMHRPEKRDGPPRKIFCNKKSVRQSEFYQALAGGMKPEIMLEIRPCDFRGEEFLELQGVRYHIDRTYTRNDEVMELTLSRQVVGHG